MYYVLRMIIYTFLRFILFRYLMVKFEEAQNILYELMKYSILRYARLGSDLTDFSANYELSISD